MRAPIKIVLSLVFAASVVGCGVANSVEDVANDVNDIQEAATQIEACTDLLKATGELLKIQILEPSEAVKKAEEKAAELRAVAGEVNDQQLKDALNKAAEKIGGLATLTPEEVASTIQEQVDLINNVKGDCN